jgi:hypothetical protein
LRNWRRERVALGEVGLLAIGFTCRHQYVDV